MSGIFEKDKHEFIRCILCNNGQHYPNLICVNSKCRNYNCGAKIISAIHNGDLCHTVYIDPNAKITYSTVKKVHQRALIQTKSMHYFQFQVEFQKLLKDFMKHSICKYVVNNTRSLMAGTRNNDFILPENAILSSFDFIGNPLIEQQQNTTNSMMANKTVSMLQIYHVRNNDGVPEKYSYCYLCDNPKHKWTTALIACKHYFATVQTKMSDSIKIFYNYSDRSCKDFSNTSFIAFLTHIWHNIGVDGHWYFTCPEEGKWLHDQCGGGNKGAYKRGIKKGDVQFNPNETPAESIKKYLIKHFNHPRFQNSNITRYFYVIDSNRVSNISSPHETLNGIMSYHAFKYIDKNKIKYKQYPCFDCYECIENNSDECLYPYVGGEWIEHEFAGLPFPEVVCHQSTTNVDQNVDILPPIPSLTRPTTARYRYDPNAHANYVDDSDDNRYNALEYVHRINDNHSTQSNHNNNNFSYGHHR